jgi:hypothetical protein
MSKGSQIVSEVTDVTRQAEAGILTHDGPAPRPDAPAQATAVFPRDGLGARSARDELMREKMQFIDPANPNPNTPFGVVQATDKDFEWLRKKREAAEFANLDAWIGRNFHKSDVASRKWLQETYPEYYESRERLMIERAKLALRIKLLQLRGPKNEKDLILQWGLQTGRIKLDEGWDRVGMEHTGPLTAAQQVYQQNRFANGLFSLRRYTGDNDRADYANVANRDNMAGLPAGYSGANPFQTAVTGPGGAQRPSPFHSGAPQDGLYTTFAQDVQPFII